MSSRTELASAHQAWPPCCPLLTYLTSSLGKPMARGLSKASQMFVNLSGLESTDNKGGEVEPPANGLGCPIQMFRSHRTTSDGDFLEVTQRDIDVAASKAVKMKHWDPTRWKFVSKLKVGRGRFGRVDCFTDTSCKNTNAAVKLVPKEWMTSSPKEFTRVHPDAAEIPWNDITFVMHLNRIGFPSVCRQLGVFQGIQQNYIVTSLATDGDLFGWIREDRSAPGDEREGIICPILSQLFSAVRCLHDMSISHQDLSVENIVLTKTNTGALQVRFIDFAMATLARSSKGVRGKPSYQPPEMHKDEEYDTFLADNFALGVVAFTMATHSYPWFSTKPGECKQFEWIQSQGLRSYLQHKKSRDQHCCLAEILSDSFVELAQGLLAINPQDRMTCGEACFTNTADSHQARSSVWETQWMTCRKLRARGGG